MFRKKEIVYFVDLESNVLGTLNDVTKVPRKGEIMIFGSDKKRYNVIEIVYTYEKKSYICWVYLNEIV